MARDFLKFSKKPISASSFELTSSSLIKSYTGSSGSRLNKLPNKISSRHGNMIIEEDNVGWNKLIDYIEPIIRSDFIAVDVGLFETTPADVVDRGAKNELGARKIPQRSYIGLTFDTNKKKLEDMVLSSMSKHFMGSKKAIEALEETGKFLEKEIVKLIDSDYWKNRKPNADITIAIKGSDHPLIDTGELKKSITTRRITGKDKK